MRYLRIRTLFAAPLLLAMLMALAGCSGDRGESRHPDRYPQRYERRDNDRRERYDGDRHKDQEKHSDHDRSNRDAR